MPRPKSRIPLLPGHLSKKTPILITSHGVGAGGAAICFHELVQVGARAVIRLGTAGGFYSGSRIGDIVVATAAIRGEGASNQMVPAAFPAVADLDLTSRLVANLRGKGWRGSAGIVLSNDLYYRALLPDQFEIYAKAGALAVEMECAPLFVLGSIHRVQTGAVLVLDGDLKSQFDNSPATLAASIETAFQGALKTLVETTISIGTESPPGVSIVKIAYTAGMLVKPSPSVRYTVGWGYHMERKDQPTHALLSADRDFLHTVSAQVVALDESGAIVACYMKVPVGQEVYLRVGSTNHAAVVIPLENTGQILADTASRQISRRQGFAIRFLGGAAA